MCATIAAHYVRAVELSLSPCNILSKTGVGILPIEIKRNNQEYSIVMTQGKIEFTQPFSDELAWEILEYLGLLKEDIDIRCPIQIVSTGHSKVMIGINSKEKLDSLTPNMEILSKLSKKIGCNGYFVFTLNSKTPNIYTHGRMFAPAIGINEDPVTGNANGPLGAAYLVKHNLIKHNGITANFYGEQGSAINRSGVVSVMVKIEKNEPIEVKIEGSAIIVFKGTIDLE